MLLPQFSTKHIHFTFHGSPRLSNFSFLIQLFVLLLNNMGNQQPKGVKYERHINDEILYPVSGNHLKQLLHRSVVAITFLIKMKVGKGSGVLITPYLVLTAAHNIYNHESREQNSDFKVYIGVDGQAKEYYKVESYKYHDQFKQISDPNKRHKYDFALLKLEKPIYFKKYLPLYIACHECLQTKNEETQISIYGFPADYQDNYKNFDQKNHKVFQLTQYGLSRTNRIKKISPKQHQIAYAINTYPGQSGTCVCTEERIIGIHTAGEEKYNVGRFITPDLVASVEMWSNELDGGSFYVIKARSCPHSEKKKKIERLEEANQKIANLSLILQEEIVKNDKQNEQIARLKRQLHESANKYEVSIKGKVLSNNGFVPSLESRSVSQASTLDRKDIETILDLSQQQLFSFDTVKFKNPDLRQLYLNCNNLIFVDFKIYPKLSRLELQKNKMVFFKSVSQNRQLTDLNLSNNHLKDINLSKNTKLKRLFLSKNQLNKIDLSFNPNICQLQLDENQISQAKFWFHPRMWDIHLQNQRSKESSIILLHRKDQYQQCEQWARKNHTFNKYRITYQPM